MNRSSFDFEGFVGRKWEFENAQGNVLWRMSMFETKRIFSEAWFLESLSKCFRFKGSKHNDPNARILSLSSPWASCEDEFDLLAIETRRSRAGAAVESRRVCIRTKTA